MSVKISIVEGDMFENPSEVLVNAVNCDGIMGAGLALQFKKRFPENYRQYREHCKKGFLRPGRVFMSNVKQKTNPQYIIDFPTVDKLYKKSTVTLEHIKDSLQELVELVVMLEIKSISIPALGCGIAGFKWDDILPLIVKAFRNKNLSDIDCEVLIFEPQEKTNGL